MAAHTLSPKFLLVWLIVTSTGAMAVLSTSPASGAATDQVSRVSVSNSGAQRNVANHWPSLSADGRFVVFCSGRSNYEDGYLVVDIFIRDRFAGTTELVSVTRTGKRVNNQTSCSTPSVSAHGRYVAFASNATNLVAGDTNGLPDVFVRDRLKDRTRLVSTANNGRPGNESSQNPTISANGRVVTFESFASNLVRRDTNRTGDVFTHNLLSGVTQRVSVRSNETQSGTLSGGGPKISAKGRYVVFTSREALVRSDTDKRLDAYVRDRKLGVTRRVSIGGTGGSESGVDGDSLAISPHGRYVAFSSGQTGLVPGDTNKRSDVFLRDRVEGTTERISVSTGGEDGNGDSSVPSISRKGRYVVFHSWAALSEQGDDTAGFQVFVRDRRTGTTRMLSVNPSQEAGNNGSGYPSISSDGDTVAFESEATDLVIDDTNIRSDIFVHEKSL